MAVKKQPESGAGELSETANDWFRQFLKHLELYIADTGQGLPPDAKNADYGLAALRAVRLALVDSGIDDGEILNLFGRVALEDANAPTRLEWNAELNRRRFELIDRDIQGTLSRAEHIELAGLTQLMREHVDSEVNVPIEGARKLHGFLSGLNPESTDSDQ
jgi:hypothetical protein